jgi:hypothetical protein
MENKSRKTHLPFWLGLGLILACANPVKAAEKFDNEVIQFDQDTIVEFEFVESRGAYQSTFGVVELNSGAKTPLLVETKPSDDNQPTSIRPVDFRGTPGNAVTQPRTEFTFKANTPYTLYLESSLRGQSGGIVYSSNLNNQGQNQQSKFEEEFAALENGRGVKISWDDTGSLLVRKSLDDRDFNDFVVIAGGFKACPFNEAIQGTVKK